MVFDIITQTSNMSCTKSQDAYFENKLLAWYASYGGVASLGMRNIKMCICHVKLTYLVDKIIINVIYLHNIYTYIHSACLNFR